eukprot:g19695.t1
MQSTATLIALQALTEQKWIQNASCSAPGVTCNDQDQVIALSLGMGGASPIPGGTVPSELTLLTQLASLEVFALPP